MDLSIIIVNLNTKRLLLDCLKTVYDTVRGLSFEVWLVDNGSTDGSVEAVKAAYPQVKIIANETNLGFAAANNLALRRMAGDYALLLNTDAGLTEGAVETLFRFMEDNPRAAMACGQLLNADGSRQNSTANFPSLMALLTNESLVRLIAPKRFPSKRRSEQGPVAVESCIGACLIVRKAAMDEVGLFDEDYFFFFEETDWAYRFSRAGWGIYFVPAARIFHYQGQTVGHGAASRIMYYRSRYIFLKKWRPAAYPIFRIVIFGRLVVNASLTLLGNLGTIGLNPGLRRRLAVYGRLIGWHLRGCPEDG